MLELPRPALSSNFTKQVGGREKFYAGTRKGEINTLLVGEVHAKKRGGFLEGGFFLEHILDKRGQAMRAKFWGWGRK